MAFATTDSPNTTGQTWNSVLYLDTSCNGVLDGTDTLLTTAVTVTAGQIVCVLNRVITPLGAPNGAQDVTALTATESWNTPTLSPVSQSRALKNTDITTVGSAGLTLIKEVRKVSSCPASASASLNDQTLYAVHGTASPGDALEYRLRYSNNTAAPISAVKLYDAVPAYTNFGSAWCLNTPTRGLNGCTVTQQPALDATSGSVQWVLTDAAAAVTGLQPLDSGAVSFCIKVQKN